MTQLGDALVEGVFEDLVSGWDDARPTCAVTTHQDDGSVRKCEERAVWIGVPPCGHEDFFCERHHSDQRAFTCLKCRRKNMLLATYRWVRL